jgi:predicted metal-dependent phosphoesterase TrpH
VIDLHTHSLVSDGTEPPERVVELAARAGLHALALTDHDTRDGLAAAGMRASALGVRLVPGVEVSCRLVRDGAAEGVSVHVLVYFAGDGPLDTELARLRDDRSERNRRLAIRLAELGMPIDLDALAASVEGGVRQLGRPHFARAMVAAGYARSEQEAFDRWLAAGRPAYVPKARLEPGAVAELARASGGVAVLAHPLRVAADRAGLDRLVGSLAEAGFVGLEAYYGDYDEPSRHELATLARRHGLVPTGGSDFHGSHKPGLAVGTGRGDLSVPDELLEELEARLAL